MVDHGGAGDTIHLRLEVTILLLLITWLVGAAPQATEDDRTARLAWSELEVGRAESAFELTRAGHLRHPGLATVHVAAAQRHAHPLEVAAICRGVIHQAVQHWPRHRELVRTCGWHLVHTRTWTGAAQQAANFLVDSDAYDHDARGLHQAALAMDALPRRRWDPPPPKGQMRQRRKRDLLYLYRYLRPEDGWLTAVASSTLLPSERQHQVRSGVHAQLDLRAHEIVLAGWRGTWRQGSSDASADHQLYGGYRLDMSGRRWSAQLDGTWSPRDGRDEAAVRLRGELTGLGTWSGDAAVVASPWGTHAAVQLGWQVDFEGLATADVRLEGRAARRVRGDWPGWPSRGASWAWRGSSAEPCGRSETASWCAIFQVWRERGPRYRCAARSPGASTRARASASCASTPVPQSPVRPPGSAGQRVRALVVRGSAHSRPLADHSRPRTGHHHSIALGTLQPDLVLPPFGL